MLSLTHMTHPKRLLLGILGLLILAFVAWVLLPLVVNRTGQDLSPLTPSSADTIPVLPDPTLPTPQLKFSGNFEPRAHRAEGLVQIIEAGDSYTLRFEDLDVLNGPDLKVYLASDETATDFIDLGPLKANRGDLNYVLDGVTVADFADYDTVLIWCRAFGVLFAAAELQAWPE